jgi:hypothetical protein
MPDKFRHRRFVTFESGTLSIDVPTPPGRHSPAIRFLRAATGQASSLVVLGTVGVG